MKQTLQLKLSQHLTLTPQLQQSIRLLQLSTLELNQELESFLTDNPLLERDEPAPEAEAVPAPYRTGDGAQQSSAPSETLSEQRFETAADSETADIDWFGSSGSSGSGAASRDDGDEPEAPALAAEAPSLRHHLYEQIALLMLNQRDRTLVELLVDALNEDGYLTQTIDELAEALPAELGIEVQELRIGLCHLQNLDPTGVGARDPAECLALQLAALPEHTPARATALALVRGHLNLLASHDFARLKKALGCGDEQLREAQRLIQRLNPRPGQAFTPSEARYVVADVIVKKTKNVWVASLNPEAMPRLRINRLYAEILHNNRGASSSRLSAQLQEARWLIKNVQQRFETILRVSQAIVDRQRHFFEHGEVAMRPLVLQEVADMLALHESTVSRVTTQKFMLTPRGIFELKYFFGSHVATEVGGACSATAIRALIKQLVAAENARQPLSDAKISQILGQQGIVVARRTIAKYRDLLHIRPLNLRRAL